MLVEVTSHASLGACRLVLDKLLHELLLLGVGKPDPATADQYSTITVQQVRV